MNNNDSVYQSTTTYIPNIDPNGKLVVNYARNEADFSIPPQSLPEAQDSIEFEGEDGIGISEIVSTIRGKSVPCDVGSAIS